MMFLMLDQQSHTSEFSAGLFTLRSLCLDPVCVCSVSFRTCSPLDVWALNLPSLSGQTQKERGSPGKVLELGLACDGTRNAILRLKPNPRGVNKAGFLL